jgi:hypothetical protein
MSRSQKKRMKDPKEIEKLRLGQIGRKRSKETKDKISESNKLLWIKRKETGFTRKQVGMLGKKHSEEAKLKMSIARKRFYQEELGQ